VAVRIEAGGDPQSVLGEVHRVLRGACPRLQSLTVEISNETTL